jgi:hypothetical protein
VPFARAGWQVTREHSRKARARHLGRGEASSDRWTCYTSTRNGLSLRAGRCLVRQALLPDPSPAVMSIPAPRKLRPWYFVLAMCLCWMVGLFGATSGCSNLSYLRGSQRLPTILEPGAEDPGTSSLVRSGIVRERARLEALAERHRVAFPLSLAQLLLSMLLVLASGAALGGRRHARTLAMQVVAANALLGLVDWILMGNVRAAMAVAVAADGVDHGLGLLPELGREASTALYRDFQMWAERIRFGLLEVGVFGGALLALTRRRTLEFFAAVASAVESGPSDSDPSPP